MQNQEFTVEQLVAKLGLQPLPGEGGLYRETYRSAETIPGSALAARYEGQARLCGTTILYLLTDQPDSFSALHRLKTDEVYHFYLGDPLEMTLLHPNGAFEQVVLGQDVFNGQQVQAVAPAGAWQGSRLARGGRFALVGTSMAPGFSPADFELGLRASLLAQYPAAEEFIRALTRF